MMLDLRPFFDKYSLKNKHIILGLSAGIDSIVLFHLLVEFQKVIPFSLSVCHVNHDLRIESNDNIIR